MPDTTFLELTTTLPLTCSRSGVCCHGKAVWINPWELTSLALAKGLSPRIFRDRFCDYGGISLRFDGPAGHKGLAACSQYIPQNGCSVHGGRPLVCRLYPLGRERRGEELRHLHRGKEFPCLHGCPEVAELPRLTVADYLAGQDIAQSAAAQDGYLELVQELADGAFVLLLETGLATGEKQKIADLWRELGNASPQDLAKRLGLQWIDRLMLPDIREGIDDPATFANKHHELLQSYAQESFGHLERFEELREASGILMGMALHLSRGLGANPAALVANWVETAKNLEANV